ncbi:hypothetical protein [Flavobacterium sp.]|uniref:hypothetical protein n=1 Tax=Flavobacterium sp. TaxID=239 RepID=UPI00260B6EE4|nr:hypothetical protein [Flavobacterium sp.]
MERILKLGRYIFPLSFLIYVGLHISKPDVGADFVPDYLPFPYFWNYFTMVCILAFIVSAVTAKYDKLAYTLMALYVLLMALLVHLPRATGLESITTAMTENTAKEQELEMVNFFRNILVFGALLGFAAYVAKDKRYFKN